MDRPETMFANWEGTWVAQWLEGDIFTKDLSSVSVTFGMINTYSTKKGTQRWQTRGRTDISQTAVEITQ